MRYAFGLVGLLVGFAIILWLMSGNAQTAIEARNKVDPQLKQLAGQASDGTRAEKSASLQPQHDSSGKFTGLLVFDIVPGGAYQTHFGLRQYDLIVQVGPLDLRAQDEGMAQALMIESFQRNQDLVVLRGGKRMTLPEPAGAPTATASPAAPGAPATPSPSKPPASHGLQGQLESIQNIPTH